MSHVKENRLGFYKWRGLMEFSISSLWLSMRTRYLLSLAFFENPSYWVKGPILQHFLEYWIRYVVSLDWMTALHKFGSDFTKPKHKTRYIWNEKNLLTVLNASISMHQILWYVFVVSLGATNFYARPL